MDNIYLSLIVPAYNEQERLASNLSEIIEYLEGTQKPYELIVVDDGSSDDTISILNDYKAKNSNVKVISYQPNMGKGYAVRMGMLESAGEYIAFSDADLSAPIEDMDKLFCAIEPDYDIAIGSRAVRGSKLAKHQPLYRELGGKALNLVIRVLAVRGIHDTQCGFKLFRGDLARKIFSMCFINGWSFDVEALYLARKLGFSIIETPVRWSHSEGSKLRPFSAGMQVIKDLVRMRFHRYERIANDTPKR